MLGSAPRSRRAAGLAAAAVLAVALATAASACDPPTNCPTPDQPTTVAYRTIPGVAKRLTSLDVHAPATAGCNKPVVLWVHGGGYQTGDKGNQIADKVALFNRQGWILVSINYRLTVPGDASSAHFPDHYEDVAAAVAWVHGTIGRYGGDPGRIALLGHSAGADIVSNVAAQPGYLAAHGLPLSTLACVGPLDTEGFDKVAASTDGEDLQWAIALGNNPQYQTETSANHLLTPASEAPDAIGVVRGTAQRRRIERAYLDEVAATGAATTLIDASTLTHNEVNSRIGAPGDTVMTPPLLDFLHTCLR
ncbi:MAG: carboxylesterase family protein [Acidimicrobiales bacterium]